MPSRKRPTISQLPMWLYPGLGIKRWLLVLFAGVTIIALGIAYLLIDVYRAVDLPDYFYWLTLQFLEHRVRGALFLFIGIVFIALALSRLSRSLSTALLPASSGSLISVVYERRGPSKKPRIVVFGTGIGLLILLRAIQDAVSRVDVVLPMGEDVDTYADLLRANRIALRSVLTPTVPGATICAEFDDGSVEKGLLTIKEARRQGHIARMFIDSGGNGPASAAELAQVGDNPGLAEAILAADAILFGPASLYVGIIPGLLAPPVAEALAATAAPKIYICNLMTEPGLTDGYSLSDHTRAIERHSGCALDYVLVNKKRVAFALARTYHDHGAQQVLLDLDDFENTYIRVSPTERLGEATVLDNAILIEEDFITTAAQRVMSPSDSPETSEKLVVRHDPEKLGATLRELFEYLQIFPGHLS